MSGLAAAGLFQQVPMLSTPSLTTNRDMFVGILKSRTVANAVVERFGLQARYRARYLEDAIKELAGATSVAASREGVISVKVEDVDPSMAANIANHYVDQLDRLVSKYNVGEAGRQRTFLTEQVARARTELELSEGALRRFQERNRAIVLQEQTRGAIEAAARLKGEIVAAQVQLQVVRSFATDSNSDVVALRRRIDEMSRQLARMQYGEGSSQPGTPTSPDFTVPFSKVPEVGLELARLTREVKVQETLVTLLTQQLENARIVEAKDMPVVQILDHAVAAERPSKPRLGTTLAVAAITSLLIALFVVFVVESTRSLRHAARAA